MNAVNFTRRQEIFALADIRTFLTECVNSAFLLTVPANYTMGVSRIGVVFTVVGYEGVEDSTSRTATARYTQYALDKDMALNIIDDLANNMWQVVDHFPFTHARVLHIYTGIQVELNPVVEE